MDPLEFTDGSHDRFNMRRQRFRNDKLPHPELRHAALWILHNCVAHPILAAHPGSIAADFHVLTSQWLSKQWTPPGGRVLYIRKLPEVTPEKKRAWVLHNLVAHMAIGLIPCKATFDFHDKTAKDMNVDGWV